MRHRKSARNPYYRVGGDPSRSAASTETAGKAAAPIASLAQQVLNIKDYDGADAEDHLGQRHGEIGGVIHQCVVPWAAAACAAAGVVAAGLPAVGLESDGGAARSTRVRRTATSLRIGAMKLSG